MNPQKMQKRRSQISGKTIIGIDPAKGKHQAAVIDANGLPVGKPFSFKDSYQGYHQRLHRQIEQFEDFIFAVETSCNLWQRLAHHFHDQGHTVVQVSPMATHHARPFRRSSIAKRRLLPNRCQGRLSDSDDCLAR